jgi:hypothetical protein
LVKTSLQQAVTAAAINVQRIVNWLVVCQPSAVG